MNRRIAISHAPSSRYPEQPPFLPARSYPEFAGVETALSEQPNPVFDAVRRLLQALSLDAARHGTPSWNPLGDLIEPGMKVALKPNWILHIHKGGGNHAAVVTHGSVLAAVLEYVGLALQGRGEVTIGDAPIQYADFDSIVTGTGARQVAESFRKRWQVPVRLVDFRCTSARKRPDGSIEARSGLAGDDRGYAAVRVDEHSRLVPIDDSAQLYRVTNYSADEMRQHHRPGWHEYCVSRSVLEADVLINLPKMKTHRKAGVTLSLKNMVGINGNKDWLPHHRAGSLAEGGDEYKNRSWRKSLNRRLSERIDDGVSHPEWMLLAGLKRALRASRRVLSPADPYSEGSWHGNDTLWRMVHDLNAVALYGRPDGKLDGNRSRRYLTIIDGVLAGQGDGPMRPDPVEAGLLVGGFCPAATDEVAARLMGYEPSFLPVLAHTRDPHPFPVRLNTEPLVVGIHPDGSGGEVDVAGLGDDPWEPAAGWQPLRRTA